MNLAVQLFAPLLALAGSPRWLRVAQREHYLPGRAAWAYRLWISRSPLSLALAGLSVVLLVVGAVALTPLLLVAAALAQTVPLGLSLRGRTSPLVWTPRVRRLAGVLTVLLVLAALLGPVLAATAAVILPRLVDAALGLTAPLERRLSRTFLLQAQERVRRVRPTVVAITGSYGKTTTKNYLAHLLGSSHTVLASPASFNNAMGLSRAVNENLVPGTEVFVAEMGTYGPGEIRALCEVFPPDIAMLTAIGEMHLERMHDRHGVLAAKTEITEKARVVVLNVDDDLLQGLADRCEQQGKQVVRCSSADPAAEVALVPGPGGSTSVLVRDEQVAVVHLPESVHPGNAACALGAVVALGDDPLDVVRRLETLPTVAHRLEPVALPNGGWLLDDTYNSNPAGAREAVRRARLLGDRAGGAFHVVTPGMVELGPVQAERNAQFASELVEAGAASLVVVGETNAKALRQGAGAAGRGTEVLGARTRKDALALMEQRSRPGDVVLFENDLPDHYP